MKIGFVGTGVMGTGIVNNLLKAGHEVTVYSRTESKAQPLIDNGAKWADTPAAVTVGQDFVFTIVGYPKDVEDVYMGKNGIFSTATSDQVLVEMTTSTPSLAIKLGKYADEHNLQLLDAPVSGGDIGAKNATLTIMVGGKQVSYDKVLPIFEQIGQRVNLFGDYGSGQHTKMANQIMIAGTMTGLTEMLVYAKAANLDLDKVLDTLNSGSAANWSMANYVPRILKQDYTPGFFAKHFLKDLRIALDEADKMDIPLPATDKARELYEKLVEEEKLGDDGTQALVKLWWS